VAGLAVHIGTQVQQHKLLTIGPWKRGDHCRTLNALDPTQLNQARRHQCAGISEANDCRRSAFFYRSGCQPDARLWPIPYRPTGRFVHPNGLGRMKYRQVHALGDHRPKNGFISNQQNGDAFSDCPTSTFNCDLRGAISTHRIQRNGIPHHVSLWGLLCVDDLLAAVATTCVTDVMIQLSFATF
jgi:hypothetical protein